jgi:PAS domain S-box-containing protein
MVQNYRGESGDLAELSRAVLSSHPAQIAVLDGDGNIIAVNDAWQAFARENGGDEATGCVGTNYLAVCNEASGEFKDEAPAAHKGILAVLRGEKDYFQLEYPCHGPDCERWFLLTAAPLKHGRGGAIISHLDISQRKKDEQHLADVMRQLQLQQRRMSDLIANVPGVVWEAYGRPDLATQRIDFVSGYVERMLGYTAAEWTGTANFWLQIVHEDDKRRAASEAATIFSSGKNGTSEFRWVAKDGRVIWVEAQSTVILDDAGSPIGMRGVTMDISARKQQEEALRRHASELATLAQQLHRKNQELDQFAYVTSHDLRAPLRGIANLASWIEEDLGPQTLTPETRKMLEQLRGRVSRMEGLIDGILEYSRVGQTKEQAETIDVARLVADTIDLLAPPPGTVEIASPMPTIESDRLQFQQVFLNLIGNAIKHAGRTDPRVTVTSRDAAESSRLVEFAVSDNGQGIDPQYHERIFVIFQTLAARDKVEGSGVGLSLVKKIVEGHGGRVWVESQPGEGATFRFTWPRVASSSRWKGV